MVDCTAKDIRRHCNRKMVTPNARLLYMIHKAGKALPQADRSAVRLIGGRSSFSGSCFAGSRRSLCILSSFSN